MFEITPQEVSNLRSQIVTTNRGGTRYNTFAFTELGVAMLSSILKSDTAIDINIRIMRAFVELRRMASIVTTDYSELRRQIDNVKEYVEDILADQNEINEDTQAQLTAINQVLAELSVDRKAINKPRRPIIGFNVPKED